jgi:hypothetical protein
LNARPCVGIPQQHGLTEDADVSRGYTGFLLVTRVDTYS